MIGNSKWSFLQVIARPYCPDILAALQGNPMRFTDLKKICKSQKTLTHRLRALEECGAIAQEMQKERKKQARLLYVLTQKGKSAMEIISALREER